MPRLNLEKTLEFVEGLHTQVSICYEMSRNDELTDELERIRDRLEALINTLTNLINGFTNE